MNSQSTVTNDTSLSRFSSRSRGSTLTAATSLEDDHEFTGGLSADTGSASSRRSQSLRSSKPKKLIKKRHLSPGGSGSEHDASPSPAEGLSRCRSPSSDWYTDNEDEHAVRRGGPQDQSERDLFARLELARQNSRSQNDTQFTEGVFDHEPQLVDEDMYEGALSPSTLHVESLLNVDEPPQPLRPLSRASRASTSTSIFDLPEIPSDSRPSSAMSRPFTPQRDHLTDSEDRISRPSSVVHTPERPRGPRTPSPLPPPRTPEIRIHDLPSEEDVTISEETIINDMAGLSVTPRQSKRVSSIPRSKRQMFEPDPAFRTPGGLFDTKPLATVEPLSIKRKPSGGMLGAHRRRVHNVGRGSPMTKPTGRVASLSRRTSSQLKQLRVPSNMLVDEAQQLVRQSESAKEVVSPTGVSGNLRAR